MVLHGRDTTFGMTWHALYALRTRSIHAQFNLVQNLHACIMASFGASVVANLAPFVGASDKFGMCVLRRKLADVIQSIGATLDVPVPVVRSASRIGMRLSASYSDELPLQIVVTLTLRLLKLPMLDAEFFESLHRLIRDLAFHSGFGLFPGQVATVPSARDVDKSSAAVLRLQRKLNRVRLRSRSLCRNKKYWHNR